MERAAFIDNIERFIIRKRDVEVCFRISKSLPERVFNERLSYFRFQEFDWAMSAKFWPFCSNTLSELRRCFDTNCRS